MDKWLSMNMNSIFWVASFLTALLFVSLWVTLFKVLRPKEEEKSRRRKLTIMAILLVVSMVGIVRAAAYGAMLYGQRPYFINYQLLLIQWIHFLSWSYALWLFTMNWFRSYKSELSLTEKKFIRSSQRIKYLWPSITSSIIMAIGIFLMFIAVHLSPDYMPEVAKEIEITSSTFLAGLIIIGLSIRHFIVSRKVLKFKQANEGVVESRKQHIIIDE